MSTAVLSAPSDLLTAEQAADLLGIKVQTLSVRRCARRYSLPFIKVGARVRYRRADIEKFLDRQTVGAAEGTN